MISGGDCLSDGARVTKVSLGSSSISRAILPMRSREHCSSLRRGKLFVSAGSGDRSIELAFERSDRFLYLDGIASQFSGRPRIVPYSVLRNKQGARRSLTRTGIIQSISAPLLMYSVFLWEVHQLISCRGSLLFFVPIQV